MNIKKYVSEKVCEAAVKLARNSIGRSIPAKFHEPKVPEALKKSLTENNHK